jgi:hypothetical protein
MLLGYIGIAVACTAGAGNIQRIDIGLRIAFGEDGMDVAVAAGAGMSGYRGMNTAGAVGYFIRVAGHALDGLYLVRMWICFDVGVAVLAGQTAVHAGFEGVTIDAYIVAGCILHGGIAVAGEAVGLCVQLLDWCKKQKYTGNPEHQSFPEQQGVAG